MLIFTNMYIVIMTVFNDGKHGRGGCVHVCLFLWVQREAEPGETGERVYSCRGCVSHHQHYINVCVFSYSFIIVMGYLYCIRVHCIFYLFFLFVFLCVFLFVFLYFYLYFLYCIVWVITVINYCVMSHFIIQIISSQNFFSLSYINSLEILLNSSQCWAYLKWGNLLRLSLSLKIK